MSTKNPKESIGKLELVREFSKIIGFKINVYKSIIFLHTRKT